MANTLEILVKVHDNASRQFRRIAQNGENMQNRLMASQERVANEAERNFTRAARAAETSAKKQQSAFAQTAEQHRRQADMMVSDAMKMFDKEEAAHKATQDSMRSEFRKTKAEFEAGADMQVGEEGFADTMAKIESLSRAADKMPDSVVRVLLRGADKVGDQLNNIDHKMIDMELRGVVIAAGMQGTRAVMKELLGLENRGLKVAAKKVVLEASLRGQRAVLKHLLDMQAEAIKTTKKDVTLIARIEHVGKVLKDLRTITTTGEKIDGWKPELEIIVRKFKESWGSLRGLNEESERFDRQKAEAEVGVNGFEKSGAKLRKLLDLSEPLRNSVLETLVKMKGVDPATTKVSTLIDELEKLNKQEANARVGINAETFDEVSKRLNDEITKLNSLKAEPQINAEEIKETELAIQLLTKKLLEFGNTRSDASMGIVGDQRAIQAIDAVQRRLSGLMDRIRGINRETIKPKVDPAQVEMWDQKARNVQKLMEDITDRTATPGVDTRFVEGGIRKLLVMQHSLDKLDHEKTILFAMQGDRPVKATLDAISNKLFALTDNPYSVGLTILGTQQAISNIDKVRNAGAALGISPFEASVLVGGTVAAIRTVRSFATTAQSILRPMMVKVGISAPGVQEKLNDLQRQLVEVNGYDPEVALRLVNQQRVQAGIAEVGGAARKLTLKQWGINIGLVGVAAVMEGLDRVRRGAEYVAAINARPRVELDGFVRTMTELKFLDGAVNALNGRRARIGIDAASAQIAAKALGNVLAVLAELQTVMAVVAAVRIPAMIGAIGGVAAAAVSAAGGIASLAAGVGEGLIGAMGASAVAATQFASGLGLIAAAALPTFSAISKHRSASQAAASADRAAASSASSLANAQRTLEKASTAVGTAQANAAKSVTQAEKAYQEALRGVDDAVRTLQEAEAGLHKAVVQAAKGVATAEKAYEDSLRSVAEAQRAVADAEQAVHRAVEQAAKSVAQAEKAYEESLRNVEDAQRAVGKAEVALHKAVEQGAKNVADAEQAYADSLRNVEDAQRAVLKAEEAVHKAVAQAAEAVARAEKTYEDSLRAVADAQEQVADAEKALHKAAEQGAKAVAAAERDYENALRSVGDAERQLGDSREELTTASRELRMAQNDLNQAMRDEPTNQAYATLDLADARDRASDATREYNEAVAEFGESSEQATDALRSMQRAQLDLGRQEQETAEIRRNGSDELLRAANAVDSASKSERDARQGVADSERALTDARRAAAESYAGIAEAQRSSAESIAEAQDQVAEAQRGVAEAARASEEAQAEIRRAQIEGAAQIADAQQGVADAQRDVQDAQRAAGEAYATIAQAQRDSAESIAAAQEQVADAQRNVADAARASEDAQAAIREAQIEGARQIADAQRGVADAQQQVQDAMRASGEAFAAIAEAQAEGAEQVAAAQQQISDAHRSVEDAQRRAGEAEAAINEARKEGARQVAEAQDAVRAAQEQVAMAMDALAEATERADAAGSRWGANLTASQQAVYDRLILLREQFMQTFASAMTAADQLTLRVIDFGARALPTLAVAAEQNVGAASRAFDTLAAAIMMPAQQASFNRFLSSIPVTTEAGITAFGQLGLTLFNVLSSGSQYGNQLALALQGATQQALLFTQSSEGIALMDQLWASAVQRALQLWTALQNVAVGLWGVVQALEAAGMIDPMMEGLVRLTEQFRAFTEQGNAGRAAIESFFVASKPILDALWNLLSTVVLEVFRVVNAIVQAGTSSGQLNPLVAVLNGMSDAVQSLGSLIEFNMVEMGPRLGPLIVNMAKLAETFLRAVPALLGFIDYLNIALGYFASLDQSTQIAIASMAGWGFLIAKIGAGPLASILGGAQRLGAILGGPLAAGISVASRVLTPLSSILTRVAFLLVGDVAKIAGVGYIFSALASPIGILIAALGALVIAGAGLITNWDSIRAYFSGDGGSMWEGMRQKVVAFATTLSEVLMARAQQAVAWFRENWPAIKDSIVGGAEAIWSTAWPILKRIFDLLVSAAQGAWPLIQRVGDTLQRVFGQVMGQLIPIVQNFLGAFANAMPILQPLGAFVGGVLVGAFKALWPIIELLAKIIAGVFLMSLRAVSLALYYFGTALGKIGEWLAPWTPLLNQIGQVVGYVFATVIGGWAFSAVAKFAQILGTAVPWLGQLASRFQFIVGPAQRFGELIMTLFNAFKTAGQILAIIVARFFGLEKVIVALITNTVPLLGGFLGRLPGIGLAILTGLSMGIRSGLGAILRVMAEVALSLWTPVSEFLGIASPSTKFAQVGVWIVQGLINGVSSLFGAVGAKMTELGAFLLRTIAAALSGLVSVVMTPFNLILRGVNGVWNMLLNAARAFWQTQLGQTILQGIQYVVATIQRNLQVVQGAWNAIWNILTTTVRVVWQNIQMIVSGAWQVLKSIFTGNGEQLRLGTRMIWQGIQNIINVVWQAIQASARVVWAAISAIIRNSWNGLQAAVRPVWQGILGVLQAVWNTIRGAAGTVWNGIRTLIVGTWTTLRNSAASIWGFILNTIRGTWQNLRAIVLPIAQAIVATVRNGWTTLQANARVVWQGIQAIFSTVWNAIKAIVNQNLVIIRQYLDTAWNIITAVIRRVWDGIRLIFSGVWTVIKGIFSSNLGQIRTGLDRTWAGIRQVVESVWNGIKAFFRLTWDAIKAIFASTSDTIRLALERVWNIIKSVTRSVWNNIKDFLATTWNTIKDTAVRVWTAIRDQLNTIMERLKEIAHRVFDAIRDGLRDRVNKARDFIVGTFTDMRDKAKGLLEDLRDSAGSLAAAIGKALVTHISRGVNNVRGWLGSLAGAVAWVLEKIGDPGGFAKGLRGAETRLKTPNPVKFARGGIHDNVERGEGGVATRITAIAGEAGREGMVPLTRVTRGGHEAMAAAAPLYGYTKAENSLSRAEAGLRERGYFAMPERTARGGGLTGLPLGGALGRRGYVGVDARQAGRRGMAAEGGESVFGATHHRYYDYIAKRISGILGAVGGGAYHNTYVNHFTSPGANEHSTVDFWAPGGRGVPINVDKGWQIANETLRNYNDGLLQILWQGQANQGGGWSPWGGIPHMDHVHIAWAANGGAIRNMPSAGGGGGTFDWLSAAKDMLADFVKKIPKFGMSGYGDLGAGLAAYAPKLVDGAKDWVWEKIKKWAEALNPFGNDVRGGPSGPEASRVARWMADNAISRGIPGRLPVMTALQESGLKNINFGDRDSLGYFQQRPSQGWGTPEQILNPAYSLDKFLDAAEGFKGQYPNTAVGLGAWAQAVQRSAFPDAYAKWWDHAGSLISESARRTAGTDPSAGHFKFGGVVRGAIGRARDAIVHGGERVLTPRQNRSFEQITDAAQEISRNRNGGAAALPARGNTTVDVGGIKIEAPLIINGNADEDTVRRGSAEHAKMIEEAVRRVLADMHNEAGMYSGQSDNDWLS